METSNAKWKRIVLFAFLAMAGFITINSCRNDFTLDAHEYARIYIPQARNNPAKLNVVTGIDSIQSFDFEAVYGGPGKPNHDIKVDFKVDPALVDTFNNKNFTTYSLFPKESYKLSGLSTTIKAGQDFSQVLHFKIDGNESISNGTYVLPITIEKTNADVPTSKDLGTVYFVITTRQIQAVHSKIIITGILANPQGSDVPAVGDTRNYPSTGVSFTFKGGLEYVQLMALDDIDFSKTPYSLVIGRYGYGAMTKGWATGGDVSFKFDLTDGKATAGTFFYVGEGQMVINGYSTAGFSTDISNANWIRNLDPNIDGKSSTLAGDGFGNSTDALMTNGDANATGIAVFKGTDVKSSSVPVDAVFYGSSVGDAYQPPNGYKIPTQSDLYNATNQGNGNSQPLFGQGSNTFTVGNIVETQGFFGQLGGKFSKGHIFQPRTPTIILLNQGSTLKDIESGAATKYVKGY